MDHLEIYDFGLRLKELRQRKGLTQNALAKKLGVRTETVNRYENNLKTPALSKVLDLAVLLNASVDYLLGLDKKPSIKLYNLNDAQCNALMEFVKQFIEKANDK